MLITLPEENNISLYTSTSRRLEVKASRVSNNRRRWPCSRCWQSVNTLSNLAFHHGTSPACARPGHMNNPVKCIFKGVTKDEDYLRNSARSSSWIHVSVDVDLRRLNCNKKMVISSILLLSPLGFILNDWVWTADSTRVTVLSKGFSECVIRGVEGKLIVSACRSEDQESLTKMCDMGDQRHLLSLVISQCYKPDGPTAGRDEKRQLKCR